MAVLLPIEGLETGLLLLALDRPRPTGLSTPGLPIAIPPTARQSPRLRSSCVCARVGTPPKNKAARNKLRDDRREGIILLYVE